MQIEAFIRVVNSHEHHLDNIVKLFLHRNSNAGVSISTDFRANVRE